MCWKVSLVMCKNLPGCSGFEGIKESRRVAEASEHEQPGEASGEGTAAGDVEVPGLKGSWRGFGLTLRGEVRDPEERRSPVSAETPTF